MFERYTEKARRVIFFARYEASEYGSPYIETEHLLLGLLREDPSLQKRFLGPAADLQKIRTEIEKKIVKREKFAVSVEIPLSSESKRVLNLAAEDADRLGHRSIGTEHLLLGLLSVQGSLAERVLHGIGIWPEQVREKLAKAGGTANVKIQEQSPALTVLEGFLSGLKKYNSEQLLPFFAKNAHFVDASGKPWDRNEIGKHFETLFILYAKKNAAYTIEEVIQDTKDVVVAVVLWKNAILASMERVWMHRMGVVLIREAEDWAIALIQVTPVKPS